MRPLPKVDLYIYWPGDEDDLLAKGVNAYYNKNGDYYSIKVEDLRGKIVSGCKIGRGGDNDNFDNMITMVVPLHVDASYFIKNGRDYFYSNIYLEKTENKLNIKLICERFAHNKFIQMQNAAEVFKETCAPRYVNTNYNRLYFELQELCHDNLLKSTYMNGLYIEKDGKRLYFQGSYIHENTKEETANSLLRNPLDIIVCFAEEKEYSIW